MKSFDINENDLHLIIKNLNANKAHGWDDISIRMIQLCGKSIALPIKLLFKTVFEERTFPEDWKKVVPIQKRIQEFDKKLSTYQSSYHFQ